MKKGFQGQKNHRWLLIAGVVMASFGLSHIHAEATMWGVAADGTTYVEQTAGNWSPAFDDGSKVYRLAPTDNGLWAIDKNGDVFFRKVSATDPLGAHSSWDKIDFLTKENDLNAKDITAAGGEVIVVTDQRAFYSREGITDADPDGTTWTKVEGPVPFEQVIVTAPTETAAEIQAGMVLKSGSIATQNAYDTAYSKAYNAAIKAGKTQAQAAIEAQAAAEKAAEKAAIAAGMTPAQAQAAAATAASSGAAVETALLAKAGATGEEFIGAISATHEFYVYNPKKNEWRSVADDLGFDDLPGSADQVDINDDGTAFAVNDVKQGFYRTGVSDHDDWVQIPDRSFTELYINNNNIGWGLDPMGTPVAVNIGDDEEKWKGTGWVEISSPKPFAHLTLTDKDVWAATADGDIYYRTGISLTNPFGSDWQQVASTERIKLIASERDGESVWALSLLGEVLFRQGVTMSNPTGTGWEKIPGTLTSLVVNDNGQPFGIDKDGALYTRTAVTAQNPMGTGWDNILEADDAAKKANAPLLKSIFISEVPLPLEGQAAKPKPATPKNKKAAEQKQAGRKAKRNKTKKQRKAKKAKSKKKDKTKKKGLKKAKKNKKAKKLAKKGKKVKGAKKHKKGKGKKKKAAQATQAATADVGAADATAADASTAVMPTDVTAVQ